MTHDHVDWQFRVVGQQNSLKLSSVPKDIEVTKRAIGREQLRITWTNCLAWRLRSDFKFTTFDFNRNNTAKRKTCFHNNLVIIPSIFVFARFMILSRIFFLCCWCSFASSRWVGRELSALVPSRNKTQQPFSFRPPIKLRRRKQQPKKKQFFLPFSSLIAISFTTTTINQTNSTANIFCFFFCSSCATFAGAYKLILDTLSVTATEIWPKQEKCILRNLVCWCAKLT